MSINNFKKIIEDISEGTSKNFRNIAFGKGIVKIRYFKLIEMKNEDDKEKYFKSIEEKTPYREWAFEILKNKFNYKDTTRIDLNDTKFLNDALMQVEYSTAVKVVEEREFDNKKEENTLQYLKIISKEDPRKEFKYEFKDNPFSYSNGKRYSLDKLDEVRHIASIHNGEVVKVTETFVDRNELY
ncbi:hypothetical protein AAGG74_15500 [Bacillus mexicanus]|uniref:hypothetical protein n=1 Tax=Bacillus mexicanus TaxID=2834415 RepID=UPI003D1FB99F